MGEWSLLSLWVKLQSHDNRRLYIGEVEMVCCIRSALILQSPTNSWSSTFDLFTLAACSGLVTLRTVRFGWKLKKKLVWESWVEIMFVTYWCRHQVWTSDLKQPFSLALCWHLSCERPCYPGCFSGRRVSGSTAAGCGAVHAPWMFNYWQYCSSIRQRVM